MIGIVVLSMVVVLFAMIIDLISGLMKAKQRHEVRSSYGLKRTLNKFIMYEGGMLIAAGVDLLIHLSHLLELFHLEVIHGIPVVTLLLGIYLLVVEGISVREKADQKIRGEMQKANEIMSKMISREELVELLTDVVKRRDEK
ncbi:MAG: phage holin family protein [Clostridia bacterium]|nr:phage holin family protein [Clostridia bacterium]